MAVRMSTRPPQYQIIDRAADDGMKKFRDDHQLKGKH